MLSIAGGGNSKHMNQTDNNLPSPPTEKQSRRSRKTTELRSPFPFLPGKAPRALYGAGGEGKPKALHSILNRFIRWLAATWHGGDALYRTVLAVWVLTMISVPIWLWAVGEYMVIQAVIAATVLQTVLGIITLRLTWGWVRAVSAALVIGVLTWLAEAIGTATGFPFSEYYYTDQLQPQAAHVPLLIPIAWMMILPSAWAISQIITQHLIKRDMPNPNPPENPGRDFPSPIWGEGQIVLVKRGLFALISALALTAWDLGLDPQMVGWGLWVWPNGGLYFGIPLMNFFGWLLTAFIGTLVVWWLIAPSPGPALPTDQLLLTYGITWFLMSFGLIFFWGLVGPGLVIFVAMGVFLVLTRLVSS